MKKLIFIFVLVVAIPSAIWAQGNAFSFQGRLNDGTNPANGAYDLEFRLYPAITGGTPIGGTVVPRPNTALVNGVFSVMLDFGSTVFTSQDSTFIEISVRPNGSTNTYTVLGPRQQLTVVPYAVRAMNSTNADNAINAQNAVNSQNAVTAQQAFNAVNATNAQTAVNAQNAANATNAISAGTANNSQSLGGVLSFEFVRRNFVNTGDLKATGGLFLDGDIRQFSTSGGAIKAMALIRVSRTPFPEFPAASATVVRCFSGTALPSATDCGITFGIVDTSDHVQINFGFAVNNRFVSLTATNDTASVIGYPNATTVEVDDTSTNRGSSEFFIYIF